MINKDEYIRKYNELVDEINQKEDVINKMTRYIAINGRKTNSMCNRNRVIECNKNQCVKCVRKYFERS